MNQYSRNWSRVPSTWKVIKDFWMQSQANKESFGQMESKHIIYVRLLVVSLDSMNVDHNI